MFTHLVIRGGRAFFTRDHLALAYSKITGTPLILSGPSLIAYWLMRLISVFYDVEKLKRGFGKNRPQTLNVLVPAFTMDTISAGFFGVFAFAIFAARCGIRVRLVLFENFFYDEKDFRESLKEYSGISDLLDKVEVTYIGHRAKPLLISPRDLAVATAWYSAYLADAIRRKCSAKYFMYLIQDYEPAFHPQNSKFVLADNSYTMPYRPWFSTTPLRDFFLEKRLYAGEEWVDYCVYQNACSPARDPAASIARKAKSVRRNFVFYCRPAVSRNLFHLGALSIIKAFRSGAFESGYNWSFYGMGIQNTEIRLGATTKLVQLPRMSLEDYQQRIGDFDLGLSLMASPHPSLVPFDLAASGCVVVTNSFDTKTPSYFAGISTNILCASPDLDSLVKFIALGVRKSGDLEQRLLGAKISYPSNWNDCWTDQHRRFLRSCVMEAF